MDIRLRQATYEYLSPKPVITSSKTVRDLRFPTKRTQFSSGHHSSSSLSQLSVVDRGHITMQGRWSSGDFSNRVLRIKAMVWMVLPRPISSARITLVFDHQLPFYPISVSIFWRKWRGGKDKWTKKGEEKPPTRKYTFCLPAAYPGAKLIGFPKAY